MYDDFLTLIDEIKANQNFDVTHYIDCLSEKYGICQRTAYSRFTSYFGTSPKKYVRALITPSKAELSTLILNSETVDELWEKLPRDKTYWGGLFDRVYGVSTFKKAKEKILSQQSVVPYTVTRDDNRSLLYSQVLGDGHYNAKRHILAIQHGMKQAEYLKWKVALMTKGYPNLNHEVKAYQHTQGHKYVSWYSGKLGNVDLPSDPDERWTLVEKLTPMGWLLWYLDDGCNGQNYSISVCNEKTEAETVRVLATYGIKSRVQAGSVIMCGMINDRLFSRAFLEPFLHLIPRSMHYKVKI